MELTIKKEFKDLIPRLSNEEYELLTKSILSDGCRESILLWNGVIVDGHNRYEICTTNNVEFNTSDIDFTDDDAAKIWIIDNQMGRRNINEWVKFELSSKKKDILLKQGREKQKETLGGFKYESSVLSIIDTTDEKETHSTRKIIAEEIGKSTAPTLATIGRMPGRLRNRTPEVQILKTVCQSGIPLKPYQKLD